MAGEKAVVGSPASINNIIFASLAINSATTTNGSSIVGIDHYTSAYFQCEVSAVTGTSPTADVYIQTLLPDGSTWQDIAHFPQASAAAHQVVYFSPGAAKSAAVQSAALAASTVQGGLGNTIRVSVVTGGTPHLTVVVYGSFFE